MYDHGEVNSQKKTCVIADRTLGGPSCPPSYIH